MHQTPIPETYQNFSPSRYTRRDRLGVSYNTAKLASTTVRNGEQITSIVMPEEQTFCNDELLLTDSRATSVNQNLVGNPNPKTEIPPVIHPRSHELEYWRFNDFVTHSAINDDTQDDSYLSGYAISNCCGLTDGRQIVFNNNQTVEGYTAPKPAQTIPSIPTLPVGNQTVEGYTAPKPAQTIPSIPTLPVYEGYSNKAIVNNFPSYVNTSCGYEQSQLAVNLPSNLPVGNCERDSALSQYNKNIFTSTIVPGVTTQTQVNEPIQSNLGISYQQQFAPIKCREIGQNVEYTAQDPNVIEPVANVSESTKRWLNQPRYDNVYDPRFYGYGTSYRSYTEPVTGQTRYAYDDVDSIRRPNYLVRSKIDHLPYADSYGPLPQGFEHGNPSTDDIRALAQDNWTRDSLQFRNDMMERLMRKRNAELWQTRTAPLGPGQVTSGRRI